MHAGNLWHFVHTPPIKFWSQSPPPPLNLQLVPPAIPPPSQVINNGMEGFADYFKEYLRVTQKILAKGTT